MDEICSDLTLFIVLNYIQKHNKTAPEVRKSPPMEEVENAFENVNNSTWLGTFMPVCNVNTHWTKCLWPVIAGQ